MADGEFYEPADHAGSDIPNRFDISGYRSGLFGGPGADLFGDPGIPGDRTVDRTPNPAVDWGVTHAEDRAAAGGTRHGSDQSSGREPEPEQGWEYAMAPQSASPERPQYDPVTETGSLVRPYTRTGGRTRPDYDLAIEALISTSDRGWEMEDALLPEHRSICGLCVETRSVAEIAAHLRLPLGVVRVLIGDMAGMGLVVIHSTGMVVGDRPSMDFLERVLSGLRRL
ncbi:MAG TPA: DUF742 domain-containing protein [Pseudonocardiaceae bacterium]|jgi:hypothetical protein|nr:DUF742 domain-containing protein [Pseudonocardiaceae bacterium]